MMEFQVVVERTYSQMPAKSVFWAYYQIVEAGIYGFEMVALGQTKTKVYAGTM